MSSKLAQVPVALFDFDGTLTTRDSFIEFIIWSHTRRSLVMRSLSSLPFFLLYGLGLYPRQQMKERALRSYFGGVKKEDFVALAEEYAGSRLPQLLRPEASERIAWHLKQGHRCLLVSASIDTYLIPWAQRMGFEAVLASRILWKEDALVGHLDGLNCWGPEKERRIREYFNNHLTDVTYAYGDTRGDREMLQLATHSFYRRLS